MFTHTFCFVFLAEMADKTQLMMMNYTKFYKISTILLSMTLGILSISGCSVVLGSWISTYIPLSIIQIIAACLFLFFGFTNLKGEKIEETNFKGSKFPFFSIALSFFIAELGDKTQLTTMALAANQPQLQWSIFFGASCGLLLANIIGIFAGKILFSFVNETFMNLFASFLFLYFGSISLLQSFSLSFLSIFLYSTTLILSAYWYYKKHHSLPHE